ncbi:MAG: hypothetical protein JO149_04295, partial [Gammaproteobacteria bacterium]|nr:hypothetical protein [Gammaproteobacteria bacterium]
QRSKIFEKIEFATRMYLAENLEVDEISLRKKVNTIILRFNDNLNSIEKIGEVTFDDFVRILGALDDQLHILGLKPLAIDMNPVNKQITQCLKNNIKHKEFSIYDNDGVDNDDAILNSGIKITGSLFTLFKELPLSSEQNDKKEISRLTRSRSFS